MQSRITRRAARRALPVALLLTLVPATAAQSQFPRPLPPPGAAPRFDASARFGWNANFTRPASTLLGSNLYASGNIRGGLSLQSVSPIGDPTAFRGSLGSAGLSDFIRDSVSPADIQSGRGFYDPRAAYFDPARTAPTAGFLSGADSIRIGRTDVGGSRTPQPGSLNYPLSTPLQHTPAIPDYGPTSALGRASSIFGVRADSPPGRTPVHFPRGAPWTPDLIPSDPLTPTIFPRDPLQQAGSRGPLPLEAPPVDSLEALLRGDAGSVLRGQGPAATDAAGEAAGVSRAADLNEMVNRDLYRAMRRANEISPLPGAAPRSPTRAMQDSAADQQQLADAARRILESPIRTLSGAAGQPAGDALAEAEGLLHAGRFYDAAQRFEQAIQLDQENPLPRLGAAHAMLGAGDYLSAGIYLLSGFERFHEITRFQVDLNALMGGGEVVDMRRADLARLLEQNEDARLRFLLAYVELYSGNQEFGLQNLERAAANAAPGSSIRRFRDAYMQTLTPAAPPKEKE